ncbi:MAG: cytidylyltransferase domain-containing protein [Vicinamibacterales bacterium]
MAWPVKAASKARFVDHVVVSTDDSEIAAAARAAGADVPFIRPAALASDTASSVSVVLHALDSLERDGKRFSYVVLLEPTSPLTESLDVERALDELHASRARADAIVGISRVLATHPEYDVTLAHDGLIRPYAALDFGHLKRRQEIPELYFLDGSLYISSVDAIRQRESFYHERTMGYAVPRWKSFEVDELVDLICIEALLRRRVELHDSEKAGNP